MEPGTAVVTTPSDPLDGLGQLLPRPAARWQDRAALVTDDRTLTFEQLNRLASRVASGLTARGVEPGDRVAPLSQNRWGGSSPTTVRCAAVSPLRPRVRGNVAINGTLMAGGQVVLVTRFDPDAAIERIDQHRATLFEGVPAMYATMLASPALPGADLSSLTRCTVGGQTIAESVIDAWEVRT